MDKQDIINLTTDTTVSVSQTFGFANGKGGNEKGGDGSGAGGNRGNKASGKSSNKASGQGSNGSDGSGADSNRGNKAGSKGSPRASGKSGNGENGNGNNKSRSNSRKGIGGNGGNGAGSNGAFSGTAFTNIPICPAFKKPNPYVPAVDESYCFDEQVTESILAGFAHNRRVMIQGRHGTGKSTHIEQVAARLNWACIRVNLDGNITRTDLSGRDAVVVEKDKQVTIFQEGLLPWSLRRPVALVFDEYDSARPEVMFVIQRVLEAEGKMTLLEKGEIVTPHPCFRLFATTNTTGLGDASGLYHGTRQLNQGQLDRWNIIAELNYLESEAEEKIILSKLKKMDNPKGKKQIKQMVCLANLTREGFKNGDISTLMSPRTVISWGENYLIFKDLAKAFRLSFLNRCDEDEKQTLNEYYQRCFATEPRPPKQKG